jgi:hypothetical protein
MSKPSEPAQTTEEPAVSEPNPQIQEFVARSLQAHYESIVQAPVPDRFLVLLAQLEAQEKKAAEAENDGQR